MFRWKLSRGVNNQVMSAKSGYDNNVSAVKRVLSYCVGMLVSLSVTLASHLLYSLLSVIQSVIACGLCSCSFCKWDKIGKEKEFN